MYVQERGVDGRRCSLNDSLNGLDSRRTFSGIRTNRQPSIFATGSLSPSGLQSQAAAGALALAGRPTAFHSNEGLNIFPLASFEQLAHRSRSNNRMVNNILTYVYLLGNIAYDYRKRTAQRPQTSFLFQVYRFKT